MADTPAVLQAAALADLLAARPDIRILDVRTFPEYEAVHISGAYNVPLDVLNEHGPEIRAHVHGPVVLVCQSGQRARQAEAALRASGIAQLHVLDGGLNAWLAAGLPAVRGPKRLPLERQVRLAAGVLAGLGGMLAVGVHPAWGILPALIGTGLAYSGVSGRCGMSSLLARLPYNRSPACEVSAMVAALKAGGPPARRAA